MRRESKRDYGLGWGLRTPGAYHPVFFSSTLNHSVTFVDIRLDSGTRGPRASRSRPSTFLGDAKQVHGLRVAHSRFSSLCISLLFYPSFLYFIYFFLFFFFLWFYFSLNLSCLYVSSLCLYNSTFKHEIHLCGEWALYAYRRMMVHRLLWICVYIFSTSHGLKVLLVQN